jgi:CRP-like cAMP-binding protein
VADVRRAQVHIFQEATGFVFDACASGSWFGETSVCAPRGRVASARTMGHCTLLTLPEAGAARLCAAFPDVGDAMEAACRWRMRRQTAARWKIMWQRHRFLILEMAAVIPRPPPPWPYPRSPASTSLPGSTA